MATSLRFCRGMLNSSTASNITEFLKPLYEFWGYCVNGTSALQSPGGMATTQSVSYSVSNVTGAGVSPIVITTTTTNALFTGQQVNITGVAGAAAANGTFQITVISNTQFSLNGTTGNGAYTGGGTINTTAHGVPVNFTEGSCVLAVGNDGYTAAQVSTTAFGDAIFTATTNQPFSGKASTLTVNQATNYTTTIAAGSNGQSLPQSTINVLATTTNTTTITASSNAVSLPTATINVVSTAGFPSGGYINVVTTEGTWLVTYTGTTATTFTGCTGGIGSMTTGGTVTAGFPASGTLSVTTGTGVQTVNYTGITATSFTGCTGGTGLMSTGGAVSAPIQLTTSTPNSYPNLGSVVVSGILGNTSSIGTWVVTTPTYNISNALFFGTNIAFPSNGAALPQGTINSGSAAPFTTTTGIQALPATPINVSATAPAATTITASSNNVTLPTGTINVTSNVGFPTSGTLNVFTTVSTTISLGSNGATLPQGTIFVASTSGFPTNGTITVTSSLGPQTVSYTGVTPISFTGCTGGTGTLTTGGAVTTPTTVPQTVTYTGLSGTTQFTGCLGGFGTMNTTNVVNNTGFFTAFPTSGSIYIVTTTGAQLISYTGVTPTSFTGCTGGSGSTSSGGSVFTAFSPASAYTSIAAGSNGASLPQSTINVAGTSVATTTIAVGSNGQSLAQSTINVASTAGFPFAGVIYVTTNGGQQVVTYTGTTATQFTGCTGGSGTMSTGGAVSFGFPNSGYIYVTTNLGYQVVTYTGISGTTFTGCSGGTGTMSTGGPVFLGYPPTGTINVVTSTGVYPVNYTGTTATTFTGATLGSGTMSTGGSITSSIAVVTSSAHTLQYNQTAITSGIVGMPNANSSFLVTPISSNVVSLNSALGAGAYVSGGTITDHQNFYLNGSIPNGAWTSGGTQQAIVSNMVGKLLVIWKPNSGTSEDSLYVITSVIGNNQLKISLNTGGTPDPATSHPSFTQRSNINYRVIDVGVAANSIVTGAAQNGNYITFQFNPSAIGLNPGQANGQVQFQLTGFQFGTNNTGFNMVMSPGGNWNGITFPVTGNYNIDATAAFGSQSGGIYNGGIGGTTALTMAADPGFFWMHFKDTNSGDGSSYIHVEIPTRLYPAAADPNPMVCLYRGGVFNGSVFAIGTSSGQNFGHGFFMKGTDGVIRTHYTLAKALAGDGGSIFGSQLTDFRLAFNTNKGAVLASDVLLTLPGVTNQFSLGRVKLRTLKYTSAPLPLYHRFGIPGGSQWLNVQNGVAMIWDNTILPSNLFFLI